MSICAHPLDPADVEAVASGSEPVVRPDAAGHAAQCPSCGEAVRQAFFLAGLLEQGAEAGPAPPDLADRVLRVRPFSRSERWSPAVWRTPVTLLAVLTGSGTGLVAGLASVREQAGLAAGIVASLAGLTRASSQWLRELSRSAPAGLEALSELLRPMSVGWAALMLLLPAGFVLRRVLARSLARR